MMTPEPDPDWACEGLAGTPRVRIVTTEGRTFFTTAGTDKVLSAAATAPTSARTNGTDAKHRSMRVKRSRAKERTIDESVIGLIFPSGLILAQLYRQ